MLLCSTIFTICCVVHSNFCYFLFVQFLVLTLIIRAFSTMLNMCISYHTWCDVFLFCKFFLCAFSKIFRMCIYSHLKCCGFSVLSIICSTPNPYPSPIRPVGVSIIIVKIYYSLYYYSLHPLSIYAEKIQLLSLHERYQPQIFWVMPI